MFSILAIGALPVSWYDTQPGLELSTFLFRPNWPDTLERTHVVSQDMNLASTHLFIPLLFLVASFLLGSALSFFGFIFAFVFFAGVAQNSRSRSFRIGRLCFLLSTMSC